VRPLDPDHGALGDGECSHFLARPSRWRDGHC
jgi:hypothetical protein